jgi:tRNA-dihydrouridine synthase
MRTPQVVGEMCTAIYDGMGIVPSVKCRLGIGEVAQYHLSTHNPSLIFELILLVRH